MEQRNYYQNKGVTKKLLSKQGWNKELGTKNLLSKQGWDKEHIIKTRMGQKKLLSKRGWDKQIHIKTRVEQINFSDFQNDAIF